MVSSCLITSKILTRVPASPQSPPWAQGPAVTGTGQDGCEASGSSRDFGEPSQHSRNCPSSRESSKEQLRRSLSHSLGSEWRRLWGPNPPGSSQLREHHLCPLSPTGDTANDKPSSRGLVCPADRAQCVCKSTAAAKTRFFSVNFWQNREEEILSLCHRT